ncbi:hypothetical protein FBY31_3484 [Arthrobacter sp. SLBN-100]|uniref:hypothetical protein n=1 Tax=Arthrobacter sp. SLBN-100 TaxID=2768450 RepID=UPI001153A5AC|nr:hypothetical protein [Arthrobacter sp. SLBN-100]TQJ69346.1 hypothetical protein FBY31_3484 [Arthrobacter sp. SLBN-100]
MRTQRPRPPFHLFRASAVATVILTLASGAHLAGGGELPAPVILLAVLALTALGSTTATRLRLDFPALATLLGGGQLALHELFTVFGSPGAAAPIRATLHTGHLAGADVLAPAVGHVHAAESTSGPLMLATHALATLACALLLAKGEAALWALAAWLRPLAALPRAVAPDAVPPALASFPAAAARRRPWRNLRQDSRRGPPSAVVPSR